MRIPARGWTSQFKKTAFSMTSTTERLQLICGLRRKDALEEERRKKLKTSFILPFLLFPAESALQQFSLSLASCPKVLSSFSPFFFLFSFFSLSFLFFFFFLFFFWRDPKTCDFLCFCRCLFPVQKKTNWLIFKWLIFFISFLSFNFICFEIYVVQFARLVILILNAAVQKVSFFFLLSSFFLPSVFFLSFFIFLSLYFSFFFSFLFFSFFFPSFFLLSSQSLKSSWYYDAAHRDCW